MRISRPFLPSLIISLALVPCAEALAAGYQVLDLGTLGSTTSGSQGRAINATGQVTGFAYPLSGPNHAYQTGPNLAISPATDDLGLFGGLESQGNAINASGQVAGYTYTDFSTLATNAFRSAGGASSSANLGTFGGTWVLAYGINDAGQVVGSSTTTSANTTTHAFRTAPNANINPATDDLGTLIAGGNSFAYGINASGQVAGQATVAGGTHAFRTTAGGVITAASDLGTFAGANQSTAQAINSAGAVVGWSYVSNNLYHAFFIPAGQTLVPSDDLGTLGGSISGARGLNDLGVVVGTSTLAGDTVQHAFIWYGSGPIVDLNTLLPANSGWVLTDAYGINASGQITGWGSHNGSNSGFVLSPVVPEPASLLLLAAGGMMILRRRRR